MLARAPYHIHAHGKLLLSAEYFVLDGALALALPTRLGQSLQVEQMHETTNQIHWKSFTVKEQCWFEAHFSIFPLEIVQSSDHQIAQRVLDLLQSITTLKPGFFKEDDAFHLKTHLDFSRQWGLGSSSTLVSALAQWAKVDPYRLLANTFGGSGYDLACAEAKGPILYQKRNQRGHYVEIPFRPAFVDQLYFVYLGQKQDSREGIQRYRNVAGKDSGLIQEISELSLAMANATSLPDFERRIHEHEQLVSRILQLDRAKELHFPDFPGAIKSLGAWGGDFVLAAAPLSQADTINYFRQKGFKTIFAYHDLIL